MSHNLVLAALADPQELERLYRARPSEFTEWLEEAASAHPDSETVRVWNARLAWGKASQTVRSNMTAFRVFLIAMASGLLVKLHVVPGVDERWYMPRFASLIVVGSLIAYFLHSGAAGRRRFAIAGALVCFGVAAALPDFRDSSSVTMSLLHLPLVMLSVLASIFMGPGWKTTESRLAFVRYLGEMGIYTGVILLGGIVMTLLTYALFELIDIRIDSWYMPWVVVLGLTSAPLVATYVYDALLGRESRIAAIISRVFAPLFLLTVIGYLAAIAAEGKSPYSDRDFLITINGLLLVVLAITIFSIAEKSIEHGSRFGDFVNIGLVAATLLINVLALSAIVYRWAEFGVTPNRVAVTGSNLLIFCHLAYLLKEYLRHFREGGAPDRMLGAVAGYLPAYSCWSVAIAIGLPLAFWFE